MPLDELADPGKPLTYEATATRDFEERYWRAIAQLSEGDLRAKNVTGKDAEDALGRAHMTVNKNAIPNDPQKPAVTSGIRIGSPALTTRGFGEAEAEKLAGLMADVLEDPRNELTLQRVAREVKTMCAKFPVYN